MSGESGQGRFSERMKRSEIRKVRAVCHSKEIDSFDVRYRWTEWRLHSRDRKDVEDDKGRARAAENCEWQGRAAWATMLT
jgi:hypothetical protein